MNDITIREAGVDDFKDFKKIHKESWLFHQKNVQWRYLPVDRYRLLQSEYEKLFDDYTILLAEKDKKVVGIILFFIKKEPETWLFKQRHYLYVSNFVVLEEYRRMWIWEKMLEAVEKKAEEKWIPEIQLDVRSFNVWAEKFYEKRGYDTTSHCMTKHI